MIDRLVALAGGSVEEILGHVLAETGYREQLATSESEEDQERLANIEELLTAARQFDERHAGDARLSEFLEEASLTSDTDAWDADVDRVTLMTLHASKGLEFPVVHVVALEDGLIPHERSRNEADELEEERRLLFVGITRAQQELHLSLAQSREFRGQRRMTIPSSFCSSCRSTSWSRRPKRGWTRWPTRRPRMPRVTMTRITTLTTITTMTLIMVLIRQQTIWRTIRLSLGRWRIRATMRRGTLPRRDRWARPGMASRCARPPSC